MAIQQSILDQYRALNWEDLLRGELGEAGKLNEVKSNFDRIKTVFDRILQYQASLSQIPNYERVLESVITSFLSFCQSQILGTSYTNITDRQTKLTYVRQQEESIISQLSAIFNYLQFADPANETKRSEIDEIQKTLEEKLHDIDSLSKRVKASLDTSGKFALQQEVQIYGNAFGDMAKKTNEPTARFNVILMYISLGLTVVIALIFIWNRNLAIPDGGSFWRSLWNQIISQNALLKIFVISAGGYLVAHFSRNYSAEMNMYYANKHRQMALDSHKRILDSVSKSEKTESDIETHNAILLQVSKTIYENQDSGYLKQSSNPVPATQIIESIRPSVSKI